MSGSTDVLRALRNRLRGYLPFSNWWILWRKLDKSAKSILDLGCGTGNPMTFINRNHDFICTGVDGFQTYLKKSQSTGRYHTLILGDARNLPFGTNEFDIVMALQVLEHLDREDGEKLVANMERMASKQVIISTDVGEHVQGAIDGNNLQVHRYIWSVGELESLGFDVYGLSPRGYDGETGYGRRIPQPLRWAISIVLQLLAGPIVYHHPKYAGAVVCIKNLK